MRSSLTFRTSAPGSRAHIRSSSDSRRQAKCSMIALTFMELTGAGTFQEARGTAEQHQTNIPPLDMTLFWHGRT